MDRPARILLARGYQATPWELRPWELLPDRFEVGYLRLEANWFDDSALHLRRFPVKAISRYLPRGRVGSLMTGVTGDRYVDADEAFAWADVVHAAELSYWFAADAARRKARNSYRLGAHRLGDDPVPRLVPQPVRADVPPATLAATDLFLPTTERARQALLLEGVPTGPHGSSTPASTSTASPRRAPARRRPNTWSSLPAGSCGRRATRTSCGHWRRCAADSCMGFESAPVRLLVVGAGPEEARLRAYAAELGLADAVEFRAVPYDEMPAVFAGASCMVLASLATASGGYVLGDIPRFFWEEQFGMVLAEAMAAGCRSSPPGQVRSRRSAARRRRTSCRATGWALRRRSRRGRFSRSPGERAEPPESSCGFTRSKRPPSAWPLPTTACWGTDGPGRPLLPRAARPRVSCVPFPARRAALRQQEV